MNLLHVLFPFLVAAGVASLMMYAGVAKRALEPRRARRVCPSCGRQARDCTCRR
jgi:hypothetical protein